MKFAVTLSMVSLLAMSLVPALASTNNDLGKSDTVLSLSPLAGGPSALPMGANATVGSKGLNLSDAQLESIHQMKNKLADELGPKKLELSKQRRSLKDLLTQKTIDKASVQSTQDKINGLHADIANSMIAFKIDFQEQLTPDQREKLRARALSGGGHRGMKRGGGKFHHKHMRRSGAEFGPNKPSTGELPSSPPVEETMFEQSQTTVTEI